MVNPIAGSSTGTSTAALTGSVAAAIKQHYRSMSNFARLIGVDKSSLSRILAGSYPGNPDNILNQCEKRLNQDGHQIIMPASQVEHEWPVLDLFSGIGGFSIGLERAGFKTVAFCEIQKVCRDWLDVFWPDVIKFNDIRQLTYERLRDAGINHIKIIAGGFPCTDISSNGNGAGIGGEQSGLWAEYARLIAEIRPDHVIIENVERLRSNGLAAILQDLWALGYDAEWHIISAANFGYLHQRERIWIIAYPAEFRLQQGILEGQSITRQPPAKLAGLGHDWISKWIETRRRDRLLCPVDGVSRQVVEWAIKAYGNAVVPEIPQFIGLAIREHEQQTKLGEAR
jgi:DNA (cytosine-5)-methyltransferase 1